MPVEQQFMILGALYLMPTILALVMQSSALGDVFLINLFLGWSGLGWLGAIIVATSAPSKKQAARQKQQAVYQQKVREARDEFYLREQEKATKQSPAA